MLEQRYDPIKNQWIANATQRQGRTFFPPKNFCPLCPTKSNDNPTEIPADNYDIVVFENKFPTFSKNADKNLPDHFNKDYFHYSKSRSKGICEVVSYTPDHDLYLEDMPQKHISNLIKVWQDRYNELRQKNFIKYVLIFENKGKEIGVTLSHPHGQIYAFPYIPPIPEVELNSSRKYFTKYNKCLHCEIIKREIEEKSRIIFQNDYFIIFIPFYAKWPHEVHIYPIRHLGNICQLEEYEINSLARSLKELINLYNKLFNFRMPYVMIIHQNPTDNKNYDYYHFHFEFYPPYRTENKLKYMAGCELGAGTFINDTLPEEKAAELRKLI
ncbi:MAG: galactose-1-phosphate uridylyltransferase [Candidatus Humimicrobiaceae bacterium]